MSKTPATLIEELIKENVLDQAQLDIFVKQAEKQDKELEQVLLESGSVKEEELLKIKSGLYRLPSKQVEVNAISPQTLKVISEDIAAFYKFVPLSQQDNVLQVGILNPEDIDAMEALKFIAADRGFQVEKYLVSFSDFHEVLRRYSTLAGEVKEALEELSQELRAKKLKAADLTPAETLAEEAPITRTVAVIIRHAVEERASDIHIEPQEDKLRVRFRIDGVLVNALSLPKSLHTSIVTRVKILAVLKIDEMRRPQDGRFSTNLQGKKIDFRVSTFPTRHGEKVVLRILDPLVGLIDLPQLGLSGRNLEVVERNLAKPFGSILITGPTGSGKTTTLYAMLRRVNEEGVNIITLEDPVEYVIEGINQSQTQEEIGYTFASGLRSILRQDPDMIMVGEIRDPETAALATHAALTGHLVFSTLHTNDSLGIIPRLIDMRVERYLIAPTLNVGIGQRLLRRLCANCRVEDQPDSGEQKIIQQALAQMSPQSRAGYEDQARKMTIWRANKKGCPECGGKAYKGRIAIFEVLEMTPELEKIILGELSEEAIRTEAERQSMITMYQDGILKVLEGLVSLEELLQVVETGNA